MRPQLEVVRVESQGKDESKTMTFIWKLIKCRRKKKSGRRKKPEVTSRFWVWENKKMGEMKDELVPWWITDLLCSVKNLYFVYELTVFKHLIGLSGKESACQCRRCGFDPWVGKIHWRRKWQPTPAFLTRKSHGQRSLAGYSPLGHKRVRYH